MDSDVSNDTGHQTPSTDHTLVAVPQPTEPCTKPPMLKSFPPLPVELVRMIMEMSAASSPLIAAALTCVCKAVQRWATPILYRTIVLRCPQQATKLYHTLLFRSPDLIGRIHNLALPHISPGYSINNPFVMVLLACHHIDGLVLAPPPMDFNQWDPRGTGLPLPTPRRVTLLKGHAIWIRHPILKNVSHLSLRGISLDGSFVNSCRSLLQLTHARFWFLPEDSRVLWLKKLLSTIPTLHMVLATVHSSQSPDITPFTLAGGPWAELANIKDKRLFVGLAPWAQEDHLTLLEPGETVWTDARARLGNWREWVLKEESSTNHRDEGGEYNSEVELD